MAKTPSAVSTVTGELFSKGWSSGGGRKGGKQPRSSAIRSRPFGLLRSQRHMLRAASGSRAAMVKLVRNGGCRTVVQLHGQLEYLLGKADAVLDSQGTYERQGPVSSEDARAAAERWAGGWRGKTRVGHTSHMVISFPIGTKPEAVQAITERFCERVLEGRFDYMAAVHVQRGPDDPAHPHAHIVVNRRGYDGELFTLRVGTEYSYESFKDVIVEIAEGQGVSLEASGRLERGILTRAPTTADYRNNNIHGRARQGDDLAYALREVARHSQTYHGLALQARALARHDLARAERGNPRAGTKMTALITALEQASKDLSSNRALTPENHGVEIMDQRDRFEDALRRLDQTVQEAENRIAAADPADRPAMQAALNSSMARIADINPHQAQTADLIRPPSEDGIYSSNNADRLTKAIDERGSEALSRELRENGIDPDEVEARMKVGARNAALERQWIADDIRAVANERGLDLKQQRDFETALAEVDRIHDRVASEYGLGAEHDSASTADQDRMHAQKAAVMDGQAGEQEGQPVIYIHGRPYRDPAHVESEDDRTLAARDRARETEEAALAANRVYTGNRPATTADLARMQAPTNEQEAQRYREAVEERLTPSEVERLKRGDASVLDGVGSRTDQLTVAREYLKAEGQSQEALQEVSRQLQAERELIRKEQGHDRGIDHG